MAMIESTAVAPVSALKTLAAPFNAIGRFLIYLAESNSRMKQLEALSAMSDEQLATRGLKREDIVMRVFGTAGY